MEPVIVANWKNWRSWAWLFFVFSLFQGYELLQWMAASNQQSLTPYFIGREYVEIYAIAILVPLFWSVARRVHYLNKPWWLWSSAQIASILIFSVGYIYLFRLGMTGWLVTQGHPTPGAVLSGPWSNVQFLGGAFSFALILAAYYGLDAYKRWRSQEAIAARLQTQLAEARVQGLMKQLEQVEPPTPSSSERLQVKADGKVWLIPVPEVVWLEANGNYVKLHTADSKHKMRDTLTALESRLAPHDFVRTHRSMLVNLNHVQAFEPWFNGDYVILMHNGEKLKLSRRYKDHVSEKLGGAL